MYDVPAQLLPKFMELSDVKKAQFTAQYAGVKKDPTTALLLAIIGFYFIYMGQIGKWFLFLLSCFIIVGTVWWIIQLVQCRKEVETYNLNQAQLIMATI